MLDTQRSLAPGGVSVLL